MKHNYQLHRVIPKLSGDVKIDVLIDSSLKSHNNNNYHTNILYTGVSPVYYGTLNSYVDDKDTPGYLEGKFKDLVELYSDKLYGISNQENFLSTGNNEYTLPYFDKYLSGTFRTRYSDFNKKSTHCTLIPLWLSDLKKSSNIQVILKILNNGNELIRKVINLSENQYIKQYLQTRIVGDGVNKNKKQGIYIDHINQKCIVYGYSLKESTVCRVETDDLYQALFNLSGNFGEKTHIETMSIIGNWFSDNQLILHQLINFGIHFDINALIGGLSDISSEQSYQISVDVLVDGKPLPFKDYYTNFDYIPAYIIGKNKGYFDVLSPNILESSSKDFNEDISSTPLLYANQLDQRLVHWTHTEGSTVGGKNGNPDTIFNTGTNFKNVKLVKPVAEDGLNSDTSKFYILPGNSYGSYTGQTNEKYDPEVHNIQWAGQVMYGSMNKCIEVLNNIDYYINENSGNFLSLIGNNNKSDIYLGLMTTPSENGVNLEYYGTTPHIPPLKDKRLYKELIPYEFVNNKNSYTKPHGYNDLRPRLYFKLDTLPNDRYRELWLIWAPHVVRPEHPDKAAMFDKLGYKECVPDYLTQGKVLNWFRKIMGGIKSANSNNSLSPEQAYYKKWWSKVVNTEYTPGILNELEDFGLLFRLPIGNKQLDYYINYNEVINGSIKYGLQHNNIQYTNYIDRLGGYIIPAFCDPNESIIKITNNSIKYFNKPGLNFQYYIKPNANHTEPYEISKLDPFKKVGYGSQQYFPRKNVGITILNTKEVPGFLNNLKEFRWFNQGRSEIIPLPKIIKQFNLNKAEVDKYLETMENKQWYNTKVFHAENNNNTYHIIRELI